MGKLGTAKVWLITVIPTRKDEVMISRVQLIGHLPGPVVNCIRKTELHGLSGSTRCK